MLPNRWRKALQPAWKAKQSATRRGRTGRATPDSDEIFAKIVAILRVAVPYTGLIISTRESKKTREKVLKLGISQISGGSSTSVGGYVTPELPDENSAQFDLSDTRTLDEIVGWLIDLGHIPSFCTACYREGRTGPPVLRLTLPGLPLPWYSYSCPKP